MASRNEFRLRVGMTVLATIATVSALLRYLVPHELHVRITTPLFGDYAREQLAVLVAHPVPEAAHRLGGAAFMVLGLLQFAPRLRARAPGLHRWTGRAWMVLALVSGLSGAYMAVAFPYSTGETAPSLLFAGVQVVSALLAWRFALRREITTHREWVTRAVAAGLGVATIRVIAVTLTLTTELHTRDIIAPTFWTGWVVTLAVAEAWIRSQRARRAAVGAALAA